MDSLGNEPRYAADKAWLETRGAGTWLRVLVPLLFFFVIALMAAFLPTPEPCNPLVAEGAEPAESCETHDKAKTEVGSGPLSGLSLQAL